MKLLSNAESFDWRQELLCGISDCLISNMFFRPSSAESLFEALYFRYMALIDSGNLSEYQLAIDSSTTERLDLNVLPTYRTVSVEPMRVVVKWERFSVDNERISLVDGQTVNSGDNVIDGLVNLLLSIKNNTPIDPNIATALFWSRASAGANLFFTAPINESDESSYLQASFVDAPTFLSRVRSWDAIDVKYIVPDHGGYYVVVTPIIGQTELNVQVLGIVDIGSDAYRFISEDDQLACWYFLREQLMVPIIEDMAARP